MSKIRNWTSVVGPGIAVAATGVGAGDMIAAAVAGAKFGHVLLWAVLLGAVLKYVLNEGISRWQLSTGTTILEGWHKNLGPWAMNFFVVYLFLWSFIVAGALISACGLAAHAIVPQLSVSVWGIIHSIVAALLVWKGKYSFFETMMKIMIGLMFVLIVFCVFMIGIDLSFLWLMFIPSIPEGSASFTMGIMGGVGGSLTLLNYGYWLQEKGWNSQGEISHTRMDLGTAYVLTGLFGIAIILISSSVNPDVMSGTKMVLGLADRIGDVVGSTGRWVFLFGFWGAVFSSMLGVWHGVPFVFQDYLKVKSENPKVSKKGYYGFLLYLAIPSMLLLLFQKPVWIVIIYAVSGAFFMPFLATTLLILNNRKDKLKNEVNSWRTNGLLILSLLVFGYLLIQQLMKWLM